MKAISVLCPPLPLKDSYLSNLMRLLRRPDPDKLLLEVPRDCLVRVDENFDRLAEGDGGQFVDLLRHLQEQERFELNSRYPRDSGMTDGALAYIPSGLGSIPKSF